MFEDICNALNWRSVDKITKGWSKDEKYRVVTQQGKTLLLRVSDIKQYDKKKKEYEMILKYAQLGFLMSFPVDFGICDQGNRVYMLLTWINGDDLEEVLPELPEEKQYLLGREAGKILKKIHSLSVDADDTPADMRKAKKLQQLSCYEQSRVRINGDEEVIRYVKQNIDQIGKEKMVYLHGDFHPGNMIYTKDDSIGIIDFNRWKAGGAYEEFYKLESFGTEASIPYCIGQIDAYFDDHIPEDFWAALSVYAAHASLYSIKWAENFSQEDVDRMIKRCLRAFDDYDYFTSYIPKWYTDSYRRSMHSGSAGSIYV